VGSVERGVEERIRVLLVDDEPDLLSVLAEDLSEAGYDVTAVTSGAAAVAAARREKFDVAVTDVKMPGMDGVETMSRLRQIDPGLPVVVATGYVSEATRCDFVERGAAGLILKPFRLEQICALLARATGFRDSPVAQGGAR
jgi:CheY-like chemotaxis protein